MLTQEDDVDAHALRKRGWSIAAIARHLGHDRKTIRAYLSGGRVAGCALPRVRPGSTCTRTTAASGCSRIRICGR